MMVLIIVFIFLFGLILGSFINCLIWRFHKKESILNRSYCPKCRKQIAWYDNIPILSFILLKAKCRHCGKAISWQYPIVELVTGVLFVYAFVQNFEFPLQIGGQGISNFEISLLITNYQLPITLFRDWFLITVMIVIFVYDLKWYLILDKVTISAIITVFLLNLLLGFGLLNLLFSGIIGGSFFLVQFIVSRGKWIGGGDIRLGLLMGVALGWPFVLVAIFLAYLIGSVIGLGLIISKKKKWGAQIPLGMFLASATIITLFWGELILNWYLKTFLFY